MKVAREKLVIISKIVLDNIFLRKKNSKSSYLNAFKITASIFLPLLIGCFTTKEYKSQTIEVLFIAATIVSAIVAFVLLILMLVKYGKKTFDNEVNLEELKEEIINNSEYKEDHTFILLFPRKRKDGLLEFPVKRRESRNNSYFFPFIANKYQEQDIQPYINDIKREISDIFNFNIPIRVNCIFDLDIQTTFLASNNLPKDYYFRYLHIYSASPFFRNYIHNKLSEDGYTYKTLDELLKDEQTLLYNRPAVKTIKDNISPVKNSIEKNEKQKSKIIWNIDKTCNNNCGICAYGTSSTIHPCLSFDERKKAINAMKSLDVDSIDFAMGAHPNINEMKLILQHAKNNLPKTTITITATAEVLNLLGDVFIKKYVDCVDITYDFPHLNTNGKVEGHRSTDYNKNNYETAKLLTSKGIPVKAHVVVHGNLNSKDVKDIRNKLWDIRIKHILLIRLMPLGNQGMLNYPEKLLQKNNYSGIVNVIKNDLKLQCALKGLTNEESPCELGYNKIGISQTGDIYTCPWAEHISTPENPFFIGNIIEDNDSLLNVLIKSSRYLETLNNNHKNQPHCKIFAYLNDENMFSKADKLHI